MQQEQEDFEVTPRYRTYVLCMFLLVYVINFVDRQIFSILIEPIREEIHLSDTQLGLLGGIAFAIFYTFAGIPIARWADVGVRKNIVAISMVIWSGMTMFTATAKSFSMLLVARIGVGIGEAGCSPPIHSLISDRKKSAPRRCRPTRSAFPSAAPSAHWPAAGSASILAGERRSWSLACLASWWRPSSG